MNYRHAFHAGNFADCMKHALFTWLLHAMARKPAAFRVMDTHAGLGRYSLAAPQAARTAEWQSGIGRLFDTADPALAEWLALVGTDGTYPGSPALAARMLRAQDRLTLIEKHPEDFAILREAFGRDPRAQLHQRDGWEALRALSPFAETRGLVLLDPPFEEPGEFERLTDAFTTLAQRQRGLVVAAWYPVKGRAPARTFHAGLKQAALPGLQACELHLRSPTDTTRLNGCGLMLRNAPFGFEEAARAILAALHARLATGEPGGGWTVERLTDG